MDWNCSFSTKPPRQQKARKSFDFRAFLLLRLFVVFHVSDKHSVPHTDGSRDASMESSENASIFKTQECLWFRLKRYHCIQRLFVSVQQKSPVWGLFVRHSTAYFYFSRYLPIMQPLFGRYQRPSVKLTPAKSSAVKT